MDRNDPNSDGCPYYWLSEWLCEYVDGTMDPSVQNVFEEYLDANPELADHVDRLCRTRSLLCGCGEARRDGSGELRARLQPHLLPSAGDPAAESTEEAAAEYRPLAGAAGMTAAVASAMVVMLGVGMFVGAALFSPAETSIAPVAPAAVAAQQPAAEQASSAAPAGARTRGEAQSRAAEDRPAIQHAPYAAGEVLVRQQQGTADPRSVIIGVDDTLGPFSGLRRASFTP